MILVATAKPKLDPRRTKRAPWRRLGADTAESARLPSGAMQRTRVAGGVAIVAGAMFAAGEALTRIVPDTFDAACNSGLAYLANIIDLLKYGLMGVTVLLLLSICGNQIPKAGRVAGGLAAAGSILAGVANGVEHCAHLKIFGTLYVVGLLFGVLSTVVFGVFVARSRTVSPWIGWGISVGVLAFFLRAEQGGAIFAAVALIVIGILLLVHPAPARGSTGPTPRPPPT